MSDSPKEAETTVFLDFMPNLIKLGQTKDAKDFLEQNFKGNLDKAVLRWGQLPFQVVRIKYFEPLSTQARSLYIDGYFTAAIALCGMAVHALCISVAIDKVQDEVLKTTLTDPSASERSKINELKKYFKMEKTSTLLHQVLSIRNDHLHLHKKANAEAALECISKLHLAILGEYGFISDDQGTFRDSTQKDIEEEAKRLGIRV